MPPQFGRPSPLPDLNRGDDIRAYAARMKGAKLQDAQRLNNDRKFYTDVQTRFSNTKPSE